jgi:hypothetical protein
MTEHALSGEAEGDGNRQSADAHRQSGSDLNSTTGWLSRSSGDTADFIRTKGWENLDAVIRSYQNLESMLGSDRAGRTIVLPRDTDDAEAYAEIYDRLGRPERPDGYELDRTGAPVDEEILDWYRSVAYEAGLSSRQASALLDAWGKMASSRIDALDRQTQLNREEATEALREKWGSRFDGKMAAAERAARRFGGEHLPALEQALGHAPVREILARIGEALAEDALPAGEGRTGFGLSPEEARSSYDQRKRDPDFIAALQDAAHPGHAAASAERARYLSAIWPGR